MREESGGPRAGLPELLPTANECIDEIRDHSRIPSGIPPRLHDRFPESTIVNIGTDVAANQVAIERLTRKSGNPLVGLHRFQFEIISPGVPHARARHWRFFDGL